VDVLLQCMSQVMKRDGDLKLAAISPEAAVILELTRTDRLFEIYSTAADAVRSFSRFIPSAMQRQPFASTTAIPAAVSRPLQTGSAAPNAKGGGTDIAA
jgi:hypothetical protein